VIFVDTSFWLGLRFRRDQRHAAAHDVFRRHAAARLVTSTPVCGETWTLLRRRADHRAAVEFLDAIEGSLRVEVVPVPPDLEAEAWQWLRRHDERPYSFVDATSFALMRRLKIRDALAFDGDFAAAGFVELRAS
jgi:predicted nucleic acid-binding protein